jgi:hypothetical protein
MHIEMGRVQICSRFYKIKWHFVNKCLLSCYCRIEKYKFVCVKCGQEEDVEFMMLRNGGIHSIDEYFSKCGLK